jgi:lysophospholipase L1-like esterase
VPKPFPFPDEARRQFAELREAQVRAEAHFVELLDSKELRLRSPDRDNLRRYREANLKTPRPNADRTRVVFLGDSITDGWRLNEYFPEGDFLNRGISGQITGEMLGRMKADVIDNKPAAMLILGGTNDLARGVPVDVIKNNLTMIVDLAQANGIKPIIASILPVSDYHAAKNPRFAHTARRPPEAIREINGWIKALCQRRGFTYCNYFDSLVDDAGMLKAELADDGLHPNSAGYRVMAPIALAAIEQATAKQVPITEPSKKRRR